jgi:Fe2+ transport system protein B
MKTAISAIVKITNYLKKTMSEITIDETKLKELLKVAIIELMQEQKEEFSETLAETLEDILIKNAIKEGENTKAVSREQIFKILTQKI